MLMQLDQLIVQVLDIALLDDGAVFKAVKLQLENGGTASEEKDNGKECKRFHVIHTFP